MLEDTRVETETDQDVNNLFEDTRVETDRCKQLVRRHTFHGSCFLQQLKQLTNTYVNELCSVKELSTRLSVRTEMISSALYFKWVWLF